MGKLQAYTNYQPVEYDYISQLPEGWKLLPNIAIFQERIERGHEDKELLSVTIGRGVIKQSELEKRDSSTLDKSKYLLVYPGDLVYSMRFRQGASGYSVYKGIVSPACTVLKPKKGVELNPRFFYYMFRTGFYKNYVERFAYGIADGQIPLRYVDFKRMYSIVPPLETQNAIVAYLDRKTKQIQDFVAKKERLIELLEEEKKSIIYKLITNGEGSGKLISSNNEWIGDIPEHWEVVKFNHYIYLRHGHQFRDYDFKNIGIKIVKITQLTYEGSLDLSNCSFVDSKRKVEFREDIINEGDILMALTGGTIGKIICAKGINEVLLQNYRVGNFFPSNKKLNKDYLFWLLSSSVIFDQIIFGQRETGQPNIGKGDFSKMFIPLPPKEEQINIVRKIESELSPYEIAVTKAQTEIAKAKEYQESLITQIVTGQLKVPDDANSNLGQDIDLGMVAEKENQYRSKIKE